MTTTDTPAPARRVDVNANNPGHAFVRLAASVTEYYVGSEGQSVGFSVGHGDRAVRVVFDGDDAVNRLAQLALTIVNWLREHRADDECHELLEAELGIEPPDLDE